MISSFQVLSRYGVRNLREKSKKSAFVLLRFLLFFVIIIKIREKVKIRGGERSMKHLRLKRSIFGLSVGQVVPFVAVKIWK